MRRVDAAHNDVIVEQNSCKGLRQGGGKGLMSKTERGKEVGERLLVVLTVLFLQFGCLPFEEHCGGIEQNCLHAKWRLVGYCKEEKDA